MKPIEYYKTNPYPYPSKEDFTKYFVYRAGKVIYEGGIIGFTAGKSTFGPNPTVEKVADEEGLREARHAYNTENNRLYSEFKTDLFDLHDVVGNPKAELCFSIAWDQGHSAGYGEIASYFDTLVDLIK